MSNQAKREYLNAIIERYKASAKREKTKILDEFCAVCDYTRPHAKALLTGKYLPKAGRRTGRPRRYQPELLYPHIRFLWMRMHQISARRMKEAYRTWLPNYNQNEVTPQIKAMLTKMSVSTLERILKKFRTQYKAKKGLGGTKPAKFFQALIPRRTLDAEIDRPGHIQADTVAHCGTTLLGDFANSLTVTDIDSTWTEARALMCKEAGTVVKTLNEIEDALPFPILSFNTDCGSEFLNKAVVNFCYNYKGRTINFTRSRPYKKNDNCYIEQKNYTHVREVFGYERIESPELIALMNEIYIEYWLPLHNFFYPNIQNPRKSSDWTEKKIYGKPKAPYERLMSSQHLSEKRKEVLRKRFNQYNPFDLSDKLQKKVHLFTQALKQSKMGESHAEAIHAFKPNA